MERFASVLRLVGCPLEGPKERFARVQRLGEQVTAVAKVGWRRFGRFAPVPRWVGWPLGDPTLRFARVQRLVAYVLGRFACVRWS